MSPDDRVDRPGGPVSYRGYQVYLHLRHVHGVWLGSFSVWRAEAGYTLSAAGNGHEMGAYLTEAAARAAVLQAATRFVERLLQPGAG
jgi:hypothetical protein